MIENQNEKSLRQAEIGMAISILIIIISLVFLDRNQYDPRAEQADLSGEQFRIFSDPPQAQITVVNSQGEDEDDLGMTNEKVLTVQDFLKKGEEAPDNWSYVVRLSKDGCLSTEITLTQSDARNGTVPPPGQPLPELKIKSPQALFFYLWNHRKGVAAGLLTGFLSLLTSGWRLVEARRKRTVLLRYEADPDPSSHLGKYLHGYLVTKFLGKGGIGSVYRVLDDKLDEKRASALKIISYEALGYEHIADPEEREKAREALERAKLRFMREMESLVTWDHPNICKILNFGREKNHDWVVMPVYDKSLESLIDEAPLPASQVLSIAKQLASGLRYAHEREIVHRDLKPDNIMMQGETVKIIDFGIAKPKNKATITALDTIMGTAKYIAPEQITGNSDYKVDQYPYGLILFELLTGEFPMVLADEQIQILQHRLLGETVKKLREVAPQYSEEMEKVIARMIDRDPAKRFPSIMAAYEAFEAAYLAQTTSSELTRVKG